MRKTLIALLVGALLWPAVARPNVGLEILEWMGAGLGVAGSALIQDHGPLFAKPLIGGRTDKPHRTETVPDAYLYGAGAGVMVLTLFVPNREGFLSGSAYENCQGLLQSIAGEELVTSLVKVSVGRKRPDFDDRVRLGLDTLNGRLSFWSGHASVAFNIATYLDCYLWDHWTTGSIRADRVAKLSLSGILFAGAAAIAWSRVTDNLHHPTDVLAGAAWGAASAYLVYRLKNSPGFSAFGLESSATRFGLTFRF